MFVGINSLASSTTEDCKCESLQNVKSCSKTDCTVVCKDGYWGEKCEFGRIRLTSPKGYITDGITSYIPSSKRVWFIDVENRANVSIHFQVEEFSTECNWDHLYIFDGDSTDSPLLASLSGYLPGNVNSNRSERIPQDIIAKSGEAYVYFYSDPNVFSMGFNISYRIIDNCPCANGKCNTAGLCVCRAGWTGSLCNMKNNCSCLNGVCNQTLGNCVCNDGFAGDSCHQPITSSSYWTNTKTEDSDEKISPRSSHAAAIIGDHMWVYNGYRYSNPTDRSYKNLYRYNLEDKTWTSVLSEENYYIWGHSMTAYQGKLIVFGGEQENQTIVNTLSVFDTNSSEWSQPFLNTSPLAVTGHTATLVGDKMIVIFGLSTNGLFPGVQEYDIVNSTWEVIKTNSALDVARHGHTSVYDSFSKRIYVYGGVTIRSYKAPLAVSDSLMAYYPDCRTWTTLASSGFALSLHSAVILDRMMIVFGGNPYTRQSPTRCHTTKLQVYDLACQKWHSEDLPQVEQTLARYGHSAVAKGRTMYIFGGFNGAFFNDLLTYTHGDCEQIMNETECTEKYFSSGCYWNSSQCVNKNSLETLPMCPSKHAKLCSEIKHCDECQSNPTCGWVDNLCKVNQSGSKTCPVPPKDICPLYSDCEVCKTGGCNWTKEGCKKGKTTKTCKKSCADRKSNKECLDESTCLWCENLKRCGDSNLYAAYYPYGQCFEWITPGSTDKDVSCESESICRDCLTLPQCGWSENESKDGTGRCLKGGALSSHDVPNWHFFDCPVCQCNGHSNCSVNSSVCLKCRDHTTGENCDSCTSGYFGKPHNGGKCEPCQCNGHADTCNPVSGECQCRMKGVSGKNCEKCNVNQYVGNATNGGYCYYKLFPDYLYKINVSNKMIFNFICTPEESDRNTVVTVQIIKGNPLNPAFLNVSIDSDNMDEDFLITNVELSSQYEEKFSKEHFSFGSENFSFRIYVYNLTPFSTVSVSVHQPNEGGIDLLKFFIIFLACFVSLLIFAVIFWKAKSFFDTFRRTRRRNVELVYMTNRPFASVPIFVEKPGHVPMKSKPSPLTSEVCYGNKAAVATVLVRLPLCAQAQNSTGVASLCLGSTLVNFNENQGSKMMNYMKNIKRRRNPFRSSAN